MNASPPAIFLMGPTAAGKTDLAVQLVDILPCEIISVDSAMVYRGMDIGTAKPDAATLERAPHRLIDIRDPAEPYSAADFRHDALREMEEISAAGRIPLLVGGTMLYFKALIRGLADLPSADSAIRRRLEAEIAEYGLPRLHGRLQEVDPAAAARIHPNDPQRIQRALEVFELTGRRLSELQASPPEPLPYRLHQLALVPQDRDELRRRISRRFKAMLEQGLVAEVEKLYQRGDLHPDLPALRAVGYRQVWRYLAGDLRFSAMVEQGITATCQFAKRQLTWLRSMPDVHWHAAEDPDVGRRLLKTLPEGFISRFR